MIVDVIWPMRNPECLARGYADCALLEQMFDHTIWTPQHAVEFRHHEVRDEFPDVEGAVVVFNGRHNAADADWLIESIDRLEWSVVILTGDEEMIFPWQRLPETERRKVWIMDPRPEQKHLSKLFPGGWYWDTREEIVAAGRQDRDLRWFFAGQVTHVRRRECAQHLRKLSGGKLIETKGFLQGVPSAEYMQYLVHAKAVPCPSGPQSCDTSRPLSAMEAGCVPILDMRKPKDPQFDYWELVFGDHPIPTLHEWSHVGDVIDDVEKQWDYLSTQVYAFWQQWKRDTAQQLNDDVLEVSRTVSNSSVDDRITVLITSSPIPSHPDTWVIEETVASVRAQLPTAEIIVVFDGVRPEQVKLSRTYHEYIRRVLWKCNFEWHNVLPVVMRQWGHQANATREALKYVKTDTILFVEHDTPICGDIPWDTMIGLVEDGTANAIRLHQDVDIHPDHEHIMLDREPKIVAGLPMRRSNAWWQRPHLASTEFYHRILAEHFPPSARTMIEDRLYGIVWVDCVYPANNWGHWKVWVYTPEGNMQRSRHLDGREGAPKYDMDYGLG